MAIYTLPFTTFDTLHTKYSLRDLNVFKFEYSTKLTRAFPSLPKLTKMLMNRHLNKFYEMVHDSLAQV